MKDPIDLGTVRITRPLANAVVTVQLTVAGRIRRRLTLRLIALAVSISGGRLVIRDSTSSDEASP